MDAIIQIWIKGKPVDQGKLYSREEKLVFLVNIDEHKWWIDEHKWWNVYGGYSIASQMLEFFAKAKLKPVILYHDVKKNLIWQTNKSSFYRMGIPVNYGGHRQHILPIAKWKSWNYDLQEPYNLPKMTTDKYLNQEPRNVRINTSVWDRLRENNDLMLKLGVVG